MNFALRHPSKRLLALLGTTLAAASVVGVAAADDVSNSLDFSVDATAESMPLNVGGAAGTTQLFTVNTNGDGKNGCNLTGGTTLTLDVASTDTSVATVSPSSVTFTACGTGPSVTVTPRSTGSASINFIQRSNTTSGSFNLAPAQFNVVVAGPANTAPSVVVAGVSGGASYDKGAVPGATCQVTDAEDGSSAFAAQLSAVSGPYASDGIGSQTASCSYRDDGGLTAASSETYSIVDPSAPTIGSALSPSTPDGDNGWYVSDVSLDWTVADLQSPFSLVKTGCVDQDITADQSATTYSCSAASAGGATGPLSFTVKRDATAPGIVRDTDADSCSTPGDDGWCRGTQTAGFNASDARSGLENGEPSPWAFTKSTSADGSAVSISSGTVKDMAGNTSDAVDAGPFKIDSVKPTISGAATPSPNAGGWNNTDVEVDFSCADTGGSGVDSCGPDVTLTGEGRGQSVTGDAEDVAGNSDSATVSGIDIDKSGPTMPAASFSKAAAYTDGIGMKWYRDEVTVSYSGSTDPNLSNGDDGSGVAGYSTPDGASTSGALNYSGQATDEADNDSAARSGVVEVDADNPTLSVTSCPTGNVALGAGASLAVVAADGQSGLKTDPSGSVALSTSAVGPHSVTISAEDNVGHTVQSTCSINVVYDWSGFYSPIDNLPALNVSKAGSAIPVKFSVDGAPRPGSNTPGYGGASSVIAAGHPASATVTCGTTAGDAVEETLTAGNSSLTYDASADQWVYVWKTDKLWAGTCRQLVVKLADGTYHRANFKLTK